MYNQIGTNQWSREANPMEFLLDPNIAYLILAGGMMLAILAVLSPGTGLLELGALFALLLAGYSMSQLPINLWAFLLLIVGVIPFLLAVRRSGQVIYLVISILAAIIGSTFLFRSEVWWLPAVNPFLAVVVSGLSGGFLWIVARKVLEAESARPTHDLGTLIGAFGEAKTDINGDGSVQVDGELWSAISHQRIERGARVRVVGREGFILEVEPAHATPP
jgi:membrane-bound serine protease (ClpP class)